MRRLSLLAGLIAVLVLGWYLVRALDEPSSAPERTGGAATEDPSVPADAPGGAGLDGLPGSDGPSLDGRDSAAKGTLVQRGRVVDGEGAGVPAIPIGGAGTLPGLGGPLLDMGRFQARTESGPDGRFELVLPRAGLWWIGPLAEHATAGWIGDPSVFELEVDVAPPPIEFVVRRAGIVRGRIAPSQHLNADTRVSALGERTGHGIWTDVAPDGTFELAPINDEPYTLVASSPGVVSAPLHGVRANGGAPAGGPLPTLQLEPTRALLVVAEGPGRERARLEFFREGARPLEWARALVAGRSPTTLRSGPHRVVATTNDSFGMVRAASLGSQASPQRVVVTLERAARLALENDSHRTRLIIVEQAGQPVRHWMAGPLAKVTLAVPPGPLLVRECDFGDATLGQTSVELAAGELHSLALSEL